MSPIGRIFVVVNLALAAVFLGWASSTLANAHKFRSLAETTEVQLQTTKAKLQEDIDSLIAERDEARRQKDQMVEQKGALEVQKRDLDTRIASLTDEKNKLNERIGSIDATLGTYSENATKALADVKAASDERTAAVEARREAESAKEDALQAQRDAQAAQKRAEEKAAELQRNLTAATEEVSRKETLLEAYAAYTGLTAQEVHGNVPTINGAVVGVMQQGDMTLVHLNVGKDNQVKRGYEFLVYNGANLKGRARVEVVNAATSTALMVDSVDGRAVAQGDRATTRL